MWHGDTVYFTSDRGPDKRLNLYSYDLRSKKIEQLTHFTDFDVNWPSLGPDAIIFENGGYLYRFDLKTQEGEKDHRRPARRPRPAAQTLGERQQADYQLRSRPGRQARGVYRPRRHLHGARREGQHPRPDPNLRSPGKVRRLVPGRPLDRLRFRPHGRE